MVERSNVANQNEVIAEIGRVISSTLNIEEVYELYADQVRKLIDYDVLGIAVIDPEGGSFRMAHRVGDELLGKTVGSHFPINGTLIGEVAVTGAAKIVQGFSKPQLQKIYPVIVSTYESGVRSWLCVPLINRREVVGTILVHSRKKNVFKQSDIELVQRVGNQIAGAIDNARLFDELKIAEAERTETAAQNEVIAEIGRIISSTLNIEEIYEPFSDQVHKLIDYDVLSIGLVNEQDQTVKIEHRVGDNILNRTTGVVAPLAGTLTGEVYKTQQVAIVQGMSKTEIQETFPQLIKTYEIRWQSTTSSSRSLGRLERSLLTSHQALAWVYPSAKR